MSLPDSIILAIIDKLLIGILILVAGFWLNQRLETLKAGLALQTALAPQRAAAYGALWEMTRSLSPRDSTTLDPLKTADLLEQLRVWYYDKGNAVHLSLDAADLFLKGLNVLARAEATDQTKIRQSFSALRTQLKVDLGVYSRADAKVQIPRAN